MRIKNESVIKSLKQQLPQYPRKVSPLGRTDRPNSWTFNVSFPDSDMKVIKVIKPRLRRDESRLESEEKALERIRRRDDINAVQYLDKGKLLVKRKELLYFIFPFVEGDDLNSYISKKGKLEENEALRIIDSITVTVLKLAEEGIIHQDIKPGNIRITPDGNVILLDFGIARFIEFDHRLAKQQGPARYLSPEQIELGLEITPINQRKITFLSDIYSASVVALHMLLGNEFYSKWKPYQRTLIVKQIKDGSFVEIKSSILKDRLIDGLQVSISKRSEILKHLQEDENLKFMIDRKIGLSVFWNLHHLKTGTKILTRFPKENPDVKGGVVLASEHMKSVENNLRSVRNLRERGWKTVIDPSTYKLAFLPEHYAWLKERPYFRPSLSTSHFYNPQFVNEFVADVISFQKQFNPDLYISPYFFVIDPDDSYLDINFNLYEETKRQLEKAAISTPLLFGLAISQQIINNQKKLDQLLDQLILYPETDAYYLRLELAKKNNRPCDNEVYLKGLLNLSKKVTTFKSLLISQIDQSILGALASTRLSVAINPEAAIRKQNIQSKLSNKPIRGGPSKENIRTWYYVPALLNDLDLRRDLKRDTVLNSDSYQYLKCNCKYCISHNDDVDSREDNYKRKAHFLLSFYLQINKIRTGIDRKEVFKQMLDGADRIYKQIDRENIKLANENNGKFLSNWRKVFLGLE